MLACLICGVCLLSFYPVAEEDGRGGRGEGKNKNQNERRRGVCSRGYAVMKAEHCYGKDWDGRREGLQQSIYKWRHARPNGLSESYPKKFVKCFHCFKCSSITEVLIQDQCIRVNTQVTNI